MTQTSRDNEWESWWDSRLASMEELLGDSDEMVGHAMIPFQVGGDADIVYFKNHVDGVVAVTSELIGCDEQVPNEQGNYELMICYRDDGDEDWGTSVISKLAAYTLEAAINPGDTMDITSAVPDGSPIVALLFCDYGRFKVRDRDAGLLLCIGITSMELTLCQSGYQEAVETMLNAVGVFPFTDLFREIEE